VRFEWDSGKSQANRRKHGVSFSQAKILFESGRDFLEVYDGAHSTDEDRFIAIGPVETRVMVVVWTEREDDTVRIISARWATPREVKLYREHMEACR
jgi:uncharacterized DUF497 family protein